MISVPITMRSIDPEVPTLETTGYAPDTDCAICVTPCFTFVDGEWRREENWRISHRPTGYRLSAREWGTKQEALDMLARCEPDFPAWPLATGDRTDAATVACWCKFRKAVELEATA